MWGAILASLFLEGILCHYKLLFNGKSALFCALSTIEKMQCIIVISDFSIVKARLFSFHGQ